MCCACRMGRDLVIDMFGAQVGAGEFTRRSGCADQADRAIAYLVDQCLKTLTGCRDWIPFRPSVMRRHHGLRRGVDQNGLGRRRPRIHSQNQRSIGRDLSRWFGDHLHPFAIEMERRETAQAWLCGNLRRGLAG